MAKSQTYPSRKTRSSNPSRSSMVSSLSSSKPQGISKLNTKSKTRELQPAAHFRFLDLPVELRNNIYQMLLDSEPDAHLSKRFRGHLVTQSAMSRVSRGIRSEYLSTVYIYAGNIKAVVKDFDFQHIVTFLNRLSDKEMNALVEGPASRQMNIELTFTNTFTGNSYSEAFKLLDRWVRRLLHPTKKGTKIRATYKVTAYKSACPTAVLEDRVAHRWVREDLRMIIEGDKIADAIGLLGGS